MTDLSASSFVTRSDVLSWGRLHRGPQHIAAPRFRDELPGLIAQCGSSCLATGLRRSYGDSCLNSAGAMIDMAGLDRLISFDQATGVLRAEAGASLSQILRIAVPRGWFLPTTPGTRYVTLGGAVANDVHGKNHHRAGSFGLHVNALGLLRSDGFRDAVSPTGRHSGLFGATIGGLGLTGVIEWVEIQLAKINSGHLDVETIPFPGLSDFWALSEESSGEFEHTVAWIDCCSHGGRLGRGIFSRANWRSDGDFTPHEEGAWKRVPGDAPTFLLNRFNSAAFNELYFRLKRIKSGVCREHYAPFFYPLDAVLDWNRLYGRRGLLQYQCVVPLTEARGAIRRILDVVARSNQTSFLAVLKILGSRASPGLLSFPRAGATLALDFSNRGAETLSLLSTLDGIVGEAGGALYPAKDGRLSADVFRRSFPRWREFRDYRDPGMNSDFWRRVGE